MWDGVLERDLSLALYQIANSPRADHLGGLLKTPWINPAGSRAALSVFVFGAYMIAQGIVLMLLPNLLLGVFGLPPAVDAWPRVVGWALAALGFYYIQSARANLTSFFAWTVPVRVLQFGFFVVIVLSGLIKPSILLVSGLELLAGVWTFLELRRTR